MDDIQAMLTDSVERAFSTEITPDLINASEQGKWPQALWELIESQGLDTALDSETNGGLELDWDSVYPLAYLAGKYAAPIPLPETLMASWLLRQAGCERPAGPLTVAQLDAAQCQPLKGQHYQITGEIPEIPWAQWVDHIVLSVDIEHQPHIALIETNQLSLSPSQNIAREPRACSSLSTPITVAMFPVPGAPKQAVTYLGAMNRSAQMAGAAARILEFSVRYASERSQFGRALNRFQVIQQYLAVLASESAALSVAARNAFFQFETHPYLPTAAAKIRSSRAAGEISSLGHAVHGAIGFTYEHQMQYFTRRLWAWRSEFGNHRWWAEKLGRATTAQPAEQWWASVTAQDLVL